MPGNSLLKYTANKQETFIKSKVQLSELNFDLINIRRPNEKNKQLLNLSYLLWKDIWSETYQSELHIKTLLYSDNFLFNQELGVLSYKKVPIGLVLFNWLDVELQAHIDHSYFTNYPLDVIEKIKKQHGEKIMLISNLTVHKEWRKSHTFYSIPEILIGLALEYFASSYEPTLLSFTRNSRKVNEIIYNYGGRPLKMGHSTHFDDDVDIVYFTKNILKKNNNTTIRNYINNNWSKYDENRIAI